MKPSDIAELLLLAALWGGSFLFMRVAAPVFGPVWLIEIRVLIAGLALLPLLLRTNDWSSIRAKRWPLFIVGCINSALPFLLLAYASVSLPAGFTSILNSTTPLFGAIVAALWLKEKLTVNRMLGFVFGFAGVSILVGWTRFALTPSFVLAIAAGLLAPMLYAVAAPYAKQQLADVSPLASVTLSQLSAALFLLPALPFTAPEQLPTDSLVWLSVLALSIFSTAIAYLIYFRLIQNIGSTKVLSVTYIIPVFAMLWGAIGLKEPITLAMLAGCALVLLGTAIANDLFQKSAGA